MKRDAALSRIRAVWGDDSTTERCFVQLLLRLKPAGANILPLHTLVRILSDADIKDSEAQKCVLWLASSALNMLKLEYEVMPYDAPDFLIKPTELHSAISDGHLAHPESGATLEDFSKYTYPVFSASPTFIELLRAEREHK